MLQLLLFEVSYCFNQQTHHLNIYPTINEMFVLPLDILFEKSDFLKAYSLSSPENNQINIKNAVELYYNTSGFEIETIDNNVTHFVALSRLPIRQIDIFDINLTSTVSIEYFDQFCNNAIFFKPSLIIMDCYNSNLLKLVIVQQQSQKEAYRIFSKNTNSTKLIACSLNNKKYLLYLQRFIDTNNINTNYSAILTMFEYDGNSTLKNVTTLYGTWIDVSCSSTENIYLINIENNLIQCQLQDNGFVEGYKQNFSNQLFAISSFNIQNQDSQSDFLVIILQGSYSIRIYKTQKDYFYFVRCYQFDLTNLNPFQTNTIQIYLNQQSLIVKVLSKILLAQNWLTLENLEDSFNISLIENKAEKVTIYLNNSNYLYQFGGSTKILFVQEPALIMNISTETSGNITLFGLQNQHFFYLDYMQISYVGLNPSNTYALPEFDTSKIIPVVTFNQSWTFLTTYYSGSLLYLDNKYNNNSNIQCNQSNITFEKINDIDPKDYQFSKIITFKTNQTKFYFLITSKYNTLTFYKSKEHDFKQIHQIQVTASIQSANSIQTSITYPSTINVGILQSTQIVIIKFYFLNNQIINSNYTNEYLSDIRSFVLTFDSIVILYYERKIITIDTLQSQSDPINYTNITYSQFFKNISQFNPVSLASNQFQQSSIIFINNQDSILILGIKYEIPVYPIIKCKNKIIQFTVLNNYLILQFQQNNENILQQWNIKNLYYPFLMKEFGVDIQKNWQLTSDNKFLFILSNQNYMQVYQPVLSQHKQLYTQFPFYDDYISSTPSLKANDFAVLSFKSGIYNLRAIVTYEISCYPVDISQFFYTFYYNYSINSQLANENENNNISYVSQINLINDSTLLNVSNIPLNIAGSHVNISLNYLNLTQNNSILEISTVNKKTNKSKCQVTNYFSTSIIVKNTQTYNIVFNIQNNFYLQNNNQIDLYDFTSNITLYTVANFSNYSYSKCLYTTVYNNFQNNLTTTICINNQSSYQLLSFNSTDITSFILLVARNISIPFEPKAIYQYENWTFILLNYSNYSDVNLNVFNLPYYSLNQQQNDSSPYNQIEFLCQPIDIEIIEVFIMPNAQPTNILIFTLCENAVNYQFGIYATNDFEQAKPLVFLQYIQIKMQFIKISILKHFQNQIEVLLTTTSSGSFIFTLNVYINNMEKKLSVTSMVSIIPPYGKFIQSSFVFHQLEYNIFNTFQSHQPQSILQTQFDKTKQIVFTLHQLNSNSTIDIPLEVQGGLQNYSNSLPISMAAYLNSSSQSLVFVIFNQSTDNGNYSIEIQQFNITNQPQISCVFNHRLLALHDSEDVEFQAKNSFDEVNFTITFIFTQTSSMAWIFLSVILIQISVFIVIMYMSTIKTEDDDNENNEL